MPRHIYIATTTDTKGQELAYVSELIQATGLTTVTVDLSTKEPGDSGTDIRAETVAGYHPDGRQAVFVVIEGRPLMLWLSLSSVLWRVALMLPLYLVWADLVVQR